MEKIKVLYIEDDQGHAASLAANLRACGQFEVKTSPTFTEALIQEHKPDLLIFDWILNERERARLGN